MTNADNGIITISMSFSDGTSVSYGVQKANLNQQTDKEESYSFDNTNISGLWGYQKSGSSEIQALGFVSRSYEKCPSLIHLVHQNQGINSTLIAVGVAIGAMFSLVMFNAFCFWSSTSFQKIFKKKTSKSAIQDENQSLASGVVSERNDHSNKHILLMDIENATIDKTNFGSMSDNKGRESTTKQVEIEQDEEQEEEDEECLD